MVFLCTYLFTLYSLFIITKSTQTNQPRSGLSAADLIRVPSISSNSCNDILQFRRQLKQTLSRLVRLEHKDTGKPINELLIILDNSIVELMDALHKARSDLIDKTSMLEKKKLDQDQLLHATHNLHQVWAQTMPVLQQKDDIIVRLQKELTETKAIIEHHDEDHSLMQRHETHLTTNQRTNFNPLQFSNWGHIIYGVLITIIIQLIVFTIVYFCKFNKICVSKDPKIPDGQVIDDKSTVNLSNHVQTENIPVGESLSLNAQIPNNPTISLASPEIVIKPRPIRFSIELLESEREANTFSFSTPKDESLTKHKSNDLSPETVWIPGPVSILHSPEIKNNEDPTRNAEYCDEG